MFGLLWEAGRVDLETIGSMKARKHSGFSIHNAVRLEAEDHAGLQRLIEYIARPPFSLARFVKMAPDGRVFYRAGRAECIRFPALGQDESLTPFELKQRLTWAALIKRCPELAEGCVYEAMH